jgi:hypothetical protein
MRTLWTRLEGILVEEEGVLQLEMLECKGMLLTMLQGLEVSQGVEEEGGLQLEVLGCEGMLLARM